MRKMFISQVMNGKTKEEIQLEIELANKLAIEYGYELEDSYIKEKCPSNLKGDNIGLWYLGKSLEHLANCEAILCMPGSSEARGCIIERLAAEKYNLKIYEANDLNKVMKL